jgi:alkylhydroperoxidase/carboxymuconolactone decarboxylase family protein YurZ
MEKGAAKKKQAEAEVKKLQSELEGLKKEFAARLSALEEHLPKAEAAVAEESISAETLALIAVAVTAYLGKKVKIRSAHLTHAASPWTQAGRAIVQASHNLKR